MRARSAGRGASGIDGAVRGVEALARSLALELKPIRVNVISPGFVDTPMTVEFEKGVLWAKPEKVAQDILLSISNGKDIKFTPWFWRYVMMVIRLIPERIFKKMSL